MLGYLRNVRWLLVLLVVGATAAMPASAMAGFDRCALAGVENAQSSEASGPDGSFPLVKIVPGATATLKFDCGGASGAPTLARQSGLIETAIGPAVQDGALWTFAVTLPGSAVPNSGQSTRLVFQEPGGGATQVIDVIPINPGGLTNNCDHYASEGGVPASLEAREPGATSFTTVPANVLCAFLTLRDARTGVRPPDASGRVGAYINVEPPFYLGENPWPFPEGTVFRISGGIPGFTPHSGAGTMKDPRLRIEGDRFVVEGQAVTRKVFDASLGESGCAGARTSTVLGGVVFGPWTGPNYRGSIVGANGYNQSSPQIGTDGSLEYFVAGCGDGDPSTLEGFYDAQFGKAFLDSGGVTQAVLEASDDAAVQALFNVTNNGVASGATFAKGAGQDGQIVVLMNYRTSFSEHTIGVRANRKATAFARKCTKAKGSRLRTKKQTIKVGKKRVKATFLTCTPRKGRPSSLRVG